MHRKMKVDPLLNNLRSFKPILPANTSRNVTGKSYYFYLKSVTRPRLAGKALESACLIDSDYFPASRPMAGLRRSGLTNADRYKSWDYNSKHQTLNDDLLAEAMRLAGIGEDAASEEAEEDLHDLSLSGLSDLSLPDDMEGWNIDDIIHTPPPPFRLPPSPDQSEDGDESDDNNTDQSQDQDDHNKSQQDSDDKTSLSAEGSQDRETSSTGDSDRESQDRDDDMDKTSDRGKDDNRDDDQDDEDQPNRMDNNGFCDLCDVPERFRSWISRGVPVYIDKKFSRQSRGKMTSEEEIQAQAHIEALQKADLIEMCGRANYVSLPKIVPKGRSKSRLVIDYSHLTDFINKTPFYLPSVYSVVFDKLPAITQDHYLIKIDLVAAFYHIKLKPEARHVTTFRWRNRHYRFKVLPMGLRISPYYMQIWLNQIGDCLRTTGAFVWGHMDDIIAVGTKNQLETVNQQCIPQLQATGVQVNFEKSKLQLSKRLVFCGASWDIRQQKITITQAKRLKLKQAVQAWPTADAKTRERIMGFIAYLWPLIDDNWASLRPMYEDDGYWEHLAAIIDQSKGTISLKHKQRNKKADIFVDATPTSIGVVSTFHTYHSQIPQTGILNAEAAALVIGLQMSNKDSIVHTDNMALYYMLRNHKTKNPHLYQWLTKCLNIMKHRNVFVRWIPSQANPADYPSRCSC